MIRVLPSRDGFAELSRGLSVVPVYCSILSDQLTPVSAFERVAPEAEHAFPLESIVGGEKIARYSFLGSGPFSLVEADDRQAKRCQDDFWISFRGRPRGRRVMSTRRQLSRKSS